MESYRQTPVLREGNQTLKVVNAYGTVSRAGNPIIRVVLADDDGAELVRSFALSGCGRLYYHNLAWGCGLNEAEARSLDPSLLIGRQVECNVYRNDAGYLDGRGWRRVGEDGW